MNNQIKKINLNHSFIFFLLCNVFSLIAFKISYYTISPLICLFLILSIGISHGALDNVKGEKLFQIFGIKNFFIFYLSYILVSIIVIILWLIVPSISLMIFLIVASHHFGKEDTQFLIIKDSYLNQLLFLLKGSLIILAPMYFHFDDTISIFKEDYHRKTLFNGIPERNLHLAHVAIISKLVAIIADSKFVAVKESTPTGVTPAKTTQPTMSKAPASPQSTGTASAVSTSYGPMLSPLGGSAISAGSTNSMAALAGASTGVGMAANSISAAMDLLEHTDVYFTSDYTSSLMDLEAYLNSADSNDFTEILDSYPVLAAIGTALYEEDLFLSLFAESMSQYFAVIKRNYEVVNKTLDKVVAGKSLRQRTAEGLEPSDDLAKCLQSFSVSLNSPHMVYDGVKTRDHLIGPDSYAHLESQLKQKKYRSKKRIFGIGLPVSLLDSTESTPEEISEVRTNRRIEKKDTFN